MIDRDKVKNDTEGPRRAILLNHKNAEDILAGVLGPKYRAYRDKWYAAEKCAMVQDYPIHLNFELFYGCNLRCIMCVNSLPLEQRNYKVEPDKKISFEKYREIIDEGVKHGLCAIALNGFNEPLLYPDDLIKHIRYAKEAGVIDIFTITNATLLTPEISEALIKSGLTQIKFSMDSIRKETYEKIRVGADFEKTLKNINTFLDIKKRLNSVLPVTRISIVKMKENMAELEEFVNYWSGKIDYITIQYMTTPFVGSPKYEKFEKESRIDARPLKQCALPYQRLYIRNNGNVLPCCSWYGREITVGNIYKDTIYDIWNGDKMKEFRKNVNGSPDAEPPQCKKCRLGASRQDKA